MFVYLCPLDPLRTGYPNNRAHPHIFRLALLQRQANLTDGHTGHSTDADQPDASRPSEDCQRVERGTSAALHGERRCDQHEFPSVQLSRRLCQGFEVLVIEQIHTHP